MPGFDDHFQLTTESKTFAKHFLENLLAAIHEGTGQPQLAQTEDGFCVEIETDLFGGSSRYEEERMISILMQTIPVDADACFYADWKLNDYRSGDEAFVKYTYSGETHILSMSGDFAYYYEYPLDVGDEDCEGLQFAIAEKQDFFESEEEFVAYIEDLGGSVTPDVSSETDYLICNEGTPISSEMKEATELGVPVISEIGFLERFGDPFEFDLDLHLVPDGPVKKIFVYSDSGWEDQSLPVKYKFIE